MKTIIAAIDIETRGKKCGRCRFNRPGKLLNPECYLFQESLTFSYNEKTGYVHADRLLQCLACDEA